MKVNHIFEDTDKVQRLIGQLLRHDWYHDYSDDHRVWKAGKAAYEAMQALAHSLTDEEYRALRDAIHNDPRLEQLSHSSPEIFKTVERFIHGANPAKARARAEMATRTREEQKKELAGLYKQHSDAVVAELGARVGDVFHYGGDISGTVEPAEFEIVDIINFGPHPRYRVKIRNPGRRENGTKIMSAALPKVGGEDIMTLGSGSFKGAKKVG